MKIFFTCILFILMTSRTFAANGEIETTLYLNEKIYNQFFMVSKRVKIPVKEWQEWVNKSTKKDKYDRPIIRFGENWTMRLNIKNNSDATYQTPILKIVFGESWGNETETIKTLQPPLKSGESINYEINLSDYEFVGVKETFVYLQISIAKDKNISMNENYYSIWFELE